MRNCYRCKYFKQNPAETECLFTGAYNYPAHSVENCEYYLSTQEIMEEFKEVLQNSNTIKVILTGVGEKQFETKEIFESLLELEKLAEIGKALERATKIGTAWVFTVRKRGRIMVDCESKCGSCLYYEKYKAKKKGDCKKNRSFFLGMPMSKPKCSLYKKKN